MDEIEETLEKIRKAKDFDKELIKIQEFLHQNGHNGYEALCHIFSSNSRKLEHLRLKLAQLRGE